MSEPTRHTVRVRTASRSYDVVVGSELESTDPLGASVVASLDRPARAALLVVDSNLPESVPDEAARSLEETGLRVERVSFVPSERDKSFETLERILKACASARLERTDPVVALGGGIVGDVAGFAGATYRRGVPLIQCPTTLLSMVDASVGGKTAVNLEVDRDGGAGLRKNMVGAFHQPNLVRADVSVLASLPDRHFRSGLAECVKHAMISADFEDADLGSWMRSNLDAILAREPDALSSLVARNVAVKARVVALDEQERAAAGGRALLNLGHTFAHAIEPIPTLSPTGDASDAPLQHGEAVALGLVCACAASERLHKLDPSIRAQLVELLTRIGLPTSVAGLGRDDEIVGAMHDDKKVASGRLRLVLPIGAGRAATLDDPPIEVVRAAIGAIRA